MTEDEAKTKVCHKTLAAPAQPMRVPGGGDIYLTPEPRHCIGSACMAWRWHVVEFHSDRQRRDTWPDLVPYGPPDQLLKRHGFCGLAAAPPAFAT